MLIDNIAPLEKAPLGSVLWWSDLIPADLENAYRQIDLYARNTLQSEILQNGSNGNGAGIGNLRDLAAKRIYNMLDSAIPEPDQILCYGTKQTSTLHRKTTEKSERLFIAQPLDFIPNNHNGSSHRMSVILSSFSQDKNTGDKGAKLEQISVFLPYVGNHGAMILADLKRGSVYHSTDPEKVQFEKISVPASRKPVFGEAPLHVWFSDSIKNVSDIQLLEESLQKTYQEESAEMLQRSHCAGREILDVCFKNAAGFIGIGMNQGNQALKLLVQMSGGIAKTGDLDGKPVLVAAAHSNAFDQAVSRLQEAFGERIKINKNNRNPLSSEGIYLNPYVLKQSKVAERPGLAGYGKYPPQYRRVDRHRYFGRKHAQFNRTLESVWKDNPETAYGDAGCLVTKVRTTVLELDRKAMSVECGIGENAVRSLEEGRAEIATYRQLLRHLGDLIKDPIHMHNKRKLIEYREGIADCLSKDLDKPTSGKIWYKLCLLAGDDEFSKITGFDFAGLKDRYAASTLRPLENIQTTIRLVRAAYPTEKLPRSNHLSDWWKEPEIQILVDEIFEKLGIYKENVSEAAGTMLVLKGLTALLPEADRDFEISTAETIALKKNKSISPDSVATILSHLHEKRIIPDHVTRYLNERVSELNAENKWQSAEDTFADQISDRIKKLGISYNTVAALLDTSKSLYAHEVSTAIANLTTNGKKVNWYQLICLIADDISEVSELMNESEAATSQRIKSNKITTEKNPTQGLNIVRRFIETKAPLTPVQIAQAAITLNSANLTPLIRAVHTNHPTLEIAAKGEKLYSWQFYNRLAKETDLLVTRDAKINWRLQYAEETSVAAAPIGRALNVIANYDYESISAYAQAVCLEGRQKDAFSSSGIVGVIAHWMQGKETGRPGDIKTRFRKLVNTMQLADESPLLAYLETIYAQTGSEIDLMPWRERMEEQGREDLLAELDALAIKHGELYDQRNLPNLTSAIEYKSRLVTEPENILKEEGEEIGVAAFLPGITRADLSRYRHARGI